MKALLTLIIIAIAPWQFAFTQERPVLLLINGMGQRKTWNHTISFFQREYNLTFGGTLLTEAAPQAPQFDLDGDFFVLQFLNQSGALDQQVSELREAMQRIYAHKKQKIILAGFSYGGGSCVIDRERILS